jgi:hypothetical protein
MFRYTVAFILIVSMIAACNAASAGAPPTQVFRGDNPYAPQPGDRNLISDQITVDSSSVFLAESQPPQVMVTINYFQPTPCHQLRVEVSLPDSQNQIHLKAYAVTEKDKACTLMALATPLQASLNLGSFPSGHYTVWLNENQIGEFTW